MKKLLLLLIMLITLTNVSYASFPVADTLKVKQDSVQTETVEQYHIRMQKMGFGISNCECKICREGNTIINNTSTNGNAKSMYILAGILFGILIIWFVIMMSSVIGCINNRSNCSDTPSNHTKNGTPITLLWMTLLGAISIGIAIKARIIQLKNRRNISN